MTFSHNKAALLLNDRLTIPPNLIYSGLCPNQSPHPRRAFVMFIRGVECIDDDEEFEPGDRRRRTSLPRPLLMMVGIEQVLPTCF